MTLLSPTGAEGSLHSAVGRWRRHVDYIIHNPSALGIIGGAQDLLQAAAGEVPLTSSYGRWMRSLSKAIDTADFAGVLNLLEDSRGEFGRSATYQWDRMASDGFVAPPPQPFPELPGLLLRTQINTMTNSGEGSEITGAQDLSGNGNIIGAGPGGQRWTFASNRFGVGSTGNGALSADGYLSVGPGNPIVDFLNGKSAATTQLTIVGIFQQRVHTTSTWVSWYNSGLLSRHLSLRTVTNTYVPQIIGGTSTGAQANISAPGASKLFNIWHPCPMIYIYRYNGAGFDLHRIDGYDDTPVARNYTGNYSVDSFAIGAGSTGAGFTRLNNMVSAEWLVYGNSLSTASCQDLELYAGTNYGCLGWKQNLGGTRPTRVYSFVGQSNCTGGCPATPTYGSQIPFISNLALDGIYKPLVEPSHDATNQVTGTLFWVQALIGASKALAMSQQLKSLGHPQDIIIVPGALPGSTADSWTVNLTNSPPDMLSLAGYAKHKTAEALKAPFARLFWIIDQGEADCDSLAETVNWPVQWSAWVAEMQAFFAGLYAKTTLGSLAYLSNPIAGVGAFSTEERNAQIAWAAANAVLIAGYQRPQGSCEAPIGLHLINTQQQNNGVIQGNIIQVAA